MASRLTAGRSATSARLPQMRCFCLIHSPALSVDTVTLRASSPCRTGPSLGFIVVLEYENEGPSACCLGTCRD